MKPLVTEKEFYDQCSLYVTEKRKQAPEEGEQRTYLLLCLHETDHNVGSWGAIIDPAISSKVSSKDFAKMTWGQQILVRTSTDIQKLIKKAIDEIQTFHNIAQQLNMSISELMNIIAASDSADDAKQKLAALMEK